VAFYFCFLWHFAFVFCVLYTETPFSQIALSYASFLDTGEYVDTTGVAKVNFSPEKSPASATANR
jgi:hypothetical protein